VKAAIVGENGAENRADLLASQRAFTGGGGGGKLGLECSGEVAAVGAAVTGFRPGDRVMASCAGGFAEFVTTDAGRVNHIPGSAMSYAQSACLPLALFTMHNAVVTAGRLKRGETLLIQGASSGVGLLGLQIGKLMGASLVIGTSTDPERRARLKEFGCELALDSRDAQWPEEVKKATGGKGVDVIVDMIAGALVNQNLEAAAVLGRIVNVGRLGGNKGEFNFDVHALKRIDYIGVTFRTRSLEEIREINRAMRADLWGAVEAGKLSLPIDKTFPLDDIGAALAMMKANAHFGKIVISI
jgi:NADPH2:quinone reductase